MKLLAPFGKVYGRVMELRNRLYDRGAFKSHGLGARTISVGNLTTGGTGKTPLVAFIAKTLVEHGEQVCILTRGYGRREPRKRVLVSDGEQVLVDAAAGGDEPVELARKLNGRAVIIADRDRVSAGRWAKGKFGVSVFILDDGFQHRRAKRDLDIVCIDATRPCGNGRILPAGSLRESFKSLSRADAIVLTRTNLVTDEEAVAITKRLRNRNSDAPIFELETGVGEVTKLEDFLAGRVTPDNDKDRQTVASAFVFCGLGNPESFVMMLKSEGLKMAGHRFFGDHKAYQLADVEDLGSAAAKSGARSFLTTAKDAVKLKEMKFDLPVFVVEIDPRINDEAGFVQMITSS